MDRPSKANAFMLGFLIYSSFLPFVLLLVLSPFGKDFYPDFVMLFGHVFIFGVPMLCYCAATKTRFCDIIPHKRLGIINIILVVLITLFTMPIIIWTASLTALFAENDTGEIINEYMNRHSMLFMIVAVAVMPAVFEELAFRGFIMSGYERCGIIKSAIFSGLFFGIMHLDLYQLPYAFAAGIIFGILVQYSNSIFSSVLAHFLVNGSQVVLGMLDLGGEEAADAVSKTEQIAAASLLLAITLPVLIGLLFAYIKLNEGKNTDYKYSLDPNKEFRAEIVKDNEKDRIFDFGFAMVILFYLLYMQLSRIFELLT